MNREVNLTKRVEIAQGWRYCPVVLSANGRVKPDVVLVDGKEERHPEGAYYLEWREGTKRVRLSVGKDAADASARRQRKEAELNAVNNGATLVESGERNGRKSLASAIVAYLEETKLSNKPKTFSAYSTALDYFQESWREQEVIHCSWPDVNLTRATVTVQEKLVREGFSPKNYREREIPIPGKLVTSLKTRKAKHDKTCQLVFPTAGCKPKLDFLDALKAIAQRAKLNKDDFWLHKFRATFATWSLWAGVDLRTVQMWLGHSDIESTMRYLKPSRSQKVQDKVNEIFA
jgi:integrase